MALKRVPEVDRKSTSEREVEHVESRTRLHARVIYEVVRLDGQTDMSRRSRRSGGPAWPPAFSLSFSLLAQAALYMHLPDTAWRPAVSDLGYSVGFLMAAMVWLLPSSADAEFHVVLVMTYLIAIGQFAHVVADSVEGFMMVLGGQWMPMHMTLYFAAPALVGNVLGGTALFALISYAQVMDEM